MQTLLKLRHGISKSKTQWFVSLSVYLVNYKENVTFVFFSVVSLFPPQKNVKVKPCILQSMIPGSNFVIFLFPIMFVLYRQLSKTVIETCLCKIFEGMQSAIKCVCGTIISHGRACGWD